MHSWPIPLSSAYASNPFSTLFSLCFCLPFPCSNHPPLLQPHSAPCLPTTVIPSAWTQLNPTPFNRTPLTAHRPSSPPPLPRLFHLKRRPRPVTAVLLITPAILRRPPLHARQLAHTLPLPPTSCAVPLPPLRSIFHLLPSSTEFYAPTTPDSTRHQTHSLLCFVFLSPCTSQLPFSPALFFKHPSTYLPRCTTYRPTRHSQQQQLTRKKNPPLHGTNSIIA